MSQLPDDSLSEELAKQIGRPLADVSLDYGELALDTILDSELVREIPIIRTVVGVSKVIGGIRGRHFARKLLAFIRETQSEGTTGSKWDEFRDRLDQDESFRRSATEHLLIMIDRFVDDDKAKITGRLLLAYIQGDIEWERFVDLTLCLEMLHRKGYALLQDLVDPPSGKPTYSGQHKEPEALLSGAGLAIRDGTAFHATEMGIDLYKFGLGPAVFPSPI